MGIKTPNSIDDMCFMLWLYASEYEKNPEQFDNKRYAFKKISEEDKEIWKKQVYDLFKIK